MKVGIDSKERECRELLVATTRATSNFACIDIDGDDVYSRSSGNVQCLERRRFHINPRGRELFAARKQNRTIMHQTMAATTVAAAFVGVSHARSSTYRIPSKNALKLCRSSSARTRLQRKPISRSMGLRDASNAGIRCCVPRSDDEASDRVPLPSSENGEAKAVALKRRRKKRHTALKIATGAAVAAVALGIPSTLFIHNRMARNHAADHNTHVAIGADEQNKAKPRKSNPKSATDTETAARRQRDFQRTALKLAFVLSGSTVAALGIILMVLISIQDKLVYKPSSVSQGEPGAHGFDAFDDVELTTDDGVRICGWLLRVSNDKSLYSKAPTMLYFHGRDKNASFRLKKVKELLDTVGCNVLLVSYRGFGESQGNPTERGMVLDAESAFEYVKSRKDIDQSKLWTYGESLGGAVAMSFAHAHQSELQGLVLENTFTSLLDMINRVHPVLTPVRGLSRNRWRSDLRMPELRIPVLLLSGLRDSFIPPRMMKELHALATASAYTQLVEFPGGTHNRTWRCKGYFDAIDDFVQIVESEAPTPNAPSASVSSSASISA